MNIFTLWVRRSLPFHWRSHFAVVLGVIAGTAALTGALLVGDSLRGSLREHALSKLADVDWLISARIPFQRDFPARLQKALAEQSLSAQVRGGLYLPGAVMHTVGGERVNRIGIFGVDEENWKVCAAAGVDYAAWEARGVILSDELARLLRAKHGDDLLLYVPRRQASSPETLLGRRDTATNTLRVTVLGVLPAHGVGEFDPRPSQQRAANAFVSINVLSRAAQLEGRSTLALLSGLDGSAGMEQQISTAIGNAAGIADYGLRIRRSDEHRYVSVESESMLLETGVENAAYSAAADIAASPIGILSYLANELRLARDPQRSIPYSIVAGIAPGSFVGQAVAKNIPANHWSTHDIFLNRWAADDLQANVGDLIEMTYYVANRFGETETRSTQFTLGGVVELSGAAADPGFVPELKGVTDAPHMSDWDPPFPVDLKKIRSRDDDYWTAHRTTPKAFVTLDRAQSLWSETPSRFGQVTSVRVDMQDRTDIETAARSFEQKLAARLWHRDMGLIASPIRAQAIEASEGTTDFSGLFIGFSFFLIASAAMLVAALFRLGIERRAKEIGALLAVGFRPKRVLFLLLAEGAVLAAIGAGFGVAGGLGYASLMLAGLRSWWSDAVNAPFLRLHVSPVSLLFGAVGGFLLAWVSIWVTTRRLSNSSSALSLLSGRFLNERANSESRGSAALPISIFTLLLGLCLAAGAALEKIPPTLGFFGSGAAMLVAAIFASRFWLTRQSVENSIVPGQLNSIFRLAFRNAARNPGRSGLVISLLASAVFLIVALGAFHTEAVDSTARDSGTGGFSLWAETTTPVLANLNTREGRDRANLSGFAIDIRSSGGASPEIFGFRLRGGDSVGCQNLYVRRDPRILGAPPEFIERGGFRFAATIDPKIENPWQLLSRPLSDGAIPVIGDEAALRWQLHKSLGETIEITDERGSTLALRIVAMLSGSLLQDELVIAEQSFERLFPSRSGYSFFLVETHSATSEQIGQIATQLENSLIEYGCDASLSRERLAGFLAVQNTYLRSFQILGGLGLLLGTIGVSAVLLRGIWERRRELALMQAVGFRPGLIRKMVIVENCWLVLLGVLAGLVPALVAVVPIALARQLSMPLTSIVLTLMSMLVLAYSIARVATRGTLGDSPRASLVSA